MDEIERLRQVAYEQWEREGRPEGRAEGHWQLALETMAKHSHANSPRATLRASKLSDLLSEANITVLEKHVLPRYLSERRWYSAKDRDIGQIRLTASPPSIDDIGVMTQVRVGLDGNEEVYSLPLAIIWDDQCAGDATELARKMTLAEIEHLGRTGVVTDAFFVPEFVRALLRNIGAGHSVGAQDGEALDFFTEDAFRLKHRSEEELRWLSAEQSNSSVIIGGHTVLKLMRRLEDGVHPEPEMCRFLTRAGYRNSSPLFAEVIHSDRAERQRTLAVAQGFVPNSGDAWTFAVEKFCEGASPGAADPDRASYASATNAIGTFASVQAMTHAVGLRLGELHSVLANGRGGPAFDQEPASDQDITVWKNAAVVQLNKALEIVSQRGKALTGASLDDESLLRLFSHHRNEIITTIEDSTFRKNGSSKIRIHGDFHLGQVLLSEQDAFIIDFEGEPARPMDERRMKSHPLRDVAGLLRSIAYAAAFHLKERSGQTRSSHESLAAQVQASRSAAENAFLRSYASAAPHGAGLEDTDEGPGLLDLFLVEKAADEVCYEAANRPEWLQIPLHGLMDALTRFPPLKKLGEKRERS
ncbi:putative maltokinase [Caballeronia sp. LZ003]|uniref:putative maltokinase n=1 Tax=Caballeronia sp. LZ003 TaxID=3038559 RepID=UPI00285D7306|nr:putative maltokinase [Caballeronia sp. LZ003]MDR5852774.1 putative maltokinase [Caballeronia sp. LZ003]